MATGDLGATDIFSPGTGWLVQSSSESLSQDVVDVLDGAGDISCQTAFGEETTATAEYELCNGATGTLKLTVGGREGGYIVKSVELSHEAGQAPRLSVEGVDWPDTIVARDRVYEIDIEAPSLSSIDVDTTALAVTGVGETTSVTRRWEMEVLTQAGGDGQILHVAPRTPMETYEESGLGSATSPLLTNYTLESFENSDSNQDMDTYSVSFKKGLTSAAAAT